MSKVVYKVTRANYNQDIELYVASRATKTGEDSPTERDLLDAVINVVAPKIREGKMEGQIPEEVTRACSNCTNFDDCKIICSVTAPFPFFQDDWTDITNLGQELRFLVAKYCKHWEIS